jgi:signal transduction protein with GAF and PtsI domain
MIDIREWQPVADICNQLKQEIGCEFVGLAIQNEVGPDIRWRYASGNLNDKFQRITVRYGKGIAGKVISSGSPMKIQDFPNDITGKEIEHPIMLAEKMIASYAVPLFFHSLPKGVLLVGKRKQYAFSEKEQAIVKESALLLENCLKTILNLEKGG